MQLEKGNYYHSSFLWVGIFNMFLPMFGLPFVTASLPHSPQFVRALKIVDKSTGKPKAVVSHREHPVEMASLVLDASSRSNAVRMSHAGDCGA